MLRLSAGPPEPAHLSECEGKLNPYRNRTQQVNSWREMPHPEPPNMFNPVPSEKAPVRFCLSYGRHRRRVSGRRRTIRKLVEGFKHDAICRTSYPACLRPFYLSPDKLDLFWSFYGWRSMQMNPIVGKLEKWAVGEFFRFGTCAVWE